MIRDEVKNIYEFKPLIKQISENLIKSHGNNNEQLVDIEYRSSSSGGEGLKDLFKSFTKFK